MMAELLIGRSTQKGALGALKEAVGPAWGLVGMWGVLCAFILLSYYTVIAGWSLFYFAKTLGWTLSGFPAGIVMGDLFGEQAGNGGLQLGLSLGFSVATVGVVYFGVQKGIERIARIFLPVLFGILVLLLISALGMSGSGEALAFIFQPNFGELEPSGFLEALGHSFFTLSRGMGVMITYGSYIARGQSIVKASAIIVLLDTLIALVATVIMFSVIFSVAGMPEQVSGTGTVGMLFISLPELFFTEMPFGAILGPLFDESPDIKVGRSQRTGTTCAVSPAHLSSSNNHRLNTLRRLLAAAEQAPQPERGLRRRPSTEARKYCSGRSQKNP